MKFFQRALGGRLALIYRGPRAQEKKQEKKQEKNTDPPPGNSPGKALEKNRFSAASPLFLIFLAAGCIAPPLGGYGGGQRQYSRTSEDYDERRRSDRDRDSVLSRARSRYDSRTRCSADSDCRKLCDDIYNRRKDREDCEALPSRQVEVLKEVYDILEDPDFDELDALDTDDFDVLINITIEPLDKLAGKYSPSEAKEVLRWIAEKSDVASVFQKEDDDFDILKDLLKELNKGEIEDALKTSIYGGKNFLDLVVDSGNDEAGEWIHSLMEDHVCNDFTGGINSEECLREYCQIADDMKDDYAEELPDFEYFGDYLEGIIDDEINFGGSDSGWATGANGFECGEKKKETEATEDDPKCPDELSDVDDRWWTKLCSPGDLSA